MGYDHLVEHLKQKYYVPSLLARAIKERYAHPTGQGFIWHRIKEGDLDNLKICLRDYFKKRLSKMLEV